MRRPRLGDVLISMIWREVGHIECVAHEVLVNGDVDDVCVVIYLLEDLEGTISSWLQLGVALLRKSVLAKV